MKIFWLVVFLTVSSKGLELNGIATAPSGGEVIYTEVHAVVLGDNGLNKKIETKYYNKKGELFAEMTSDFSKHPKIPEVKFSDSRFAKNEELNYNPTDGQVVFKTTTKDKKTETKTYKVTDEMAAAQGFDNFVKINFEKLGQSSVPLRFGVLSEMDFFSFKGYKKKNVSKNVIQFGIELSSFLLRMFSSELVLEYDITSRRILSYKGLSNILSDEGKPQDVLIKYTSATEGANQ